MFRFLWNIYKYPKIQAKSKGVEFARPRPARIFIHCIFVYRNLIPHVDNPLGVRGPLRSSQWPHLSLTVGAPLRRPAGLVHEAYPAEGLTGLFVPGVSAKRIPVSAFKRFTGPFAALGISLNPASSAAGSAHSSGSRRLPIAVNGSAVAAESPAPQGFPCRNVAPMPQAQVVPVILEKVPQGTFSASLLLLCEVV